MCVRVCFVTNCYLQKSPPRFQTSGFTTKEGCAPWNLTRLLFEATLTRVLLQLQRSCVFQDERFVGAEATRVRHTAATTSGLDYWLLSCDDMQPPVICWFTSYDWGAAVVVNLTKAFNWFYLLLYSSVGLRDWGFVVEIQALIFHFGLGWKRMMMLYMIHTY